MKRNAVDDEEMAEYVALFAERLGAAVERQNQSLRTIASAAGISHTTLSRLIAGRATPTFAVLRSLELTLGADLWPGRSTRRGGR